MKNDKIRSTSVDFHMKAIVFMIICHILIIAYFNCKQTYTVCELEKTYTESVNEERDSLTEEKYFDEAEKEETEVEEHTMTVSRENSIYIPGTGINNSFTISSFTQSAIDDFDIVYTESTEGGSNNPFVLGHNYRTLGNLDRAEVGQNIYIVKNGVIEIYKIVVSEYGLQNTSWTDIVGQSTGTSVWHNYDCKTLHIYTCYGSDVDGRWMVLATLVS